VASSIYEACKYFTLFQKTQFKGKCAVVTSYNPQTRDVTLEETGANTETDKQFIYNTYNELLKDITPSKTCPTPNLRRMKPKAFHQRTPT
jgi:type I restriction enzyme, R subunit